MKKITLCLAIVTLVCFSQKILHASASASVSLSPSEMWYDSQNQEITYTVTNTGTEEIKSIEINILSGFTYVSSQILSVSSGKSWAITGFNSTNHTITLVAQGTLNNLASGAYITLKIIVNTQSDPLSATSFTCSAVHTISGSITATEASSNSSKISIISLKLSANPKVYALIPNTTSEITVTLWNDSNDLLSNKNISCEVINGSAVIISSTGVILSSQTLTTDIAGKVVFGIKLTGTTTVSSATFRCAYNNPKRMMDVAVLSITDAPTLVPQSGFCSGSKVYSKDNAPVDINNKYKEYNGTVVGYKIDNNDWKTYVSSQPLYFGYRKAEPYEVKCVYTDGQGNKSSENTWKVFATYAEPNSKLVNFPNPFSAGSQSTTLQYDLEENSDVIISIYDLFGNLLLKREFLAGDDCAKTGSNSFHWDGKNDEGKVVANGGYICKIKIKQIGNSKTLTRKIGVRK